MGLSNRGIIPALAGNITAATTMKQFLMDHPRACGEHILSSKLPQAREGSSPRLRGTYCKNDDECIHDGIIPALAGNIFRFHARLRRAMGGNGKH